MNNEQTVDCLNTILQYLNDSHNGYQLNQEDISNQRLKSTLGKLCSQRSAMIEEIKSKIHECGGSPSNRQTIAGTLHQWYQDIKNAVMGGDPVTISKQIRFGETVLIDKYKEALSETLPDHIRQLLMTQLSQIEDGLKEVDMEAINN